jgi:hypothetical protein
MKSYVERVQDIAFKSPSDRLAIVAHFPEIGTQLDEWDSTASTWQKLIESIDARFNQEMSSRGFFERPFVQEGFPTLLDEANYKATHETLMDGAQIPWRSPGESPEGHLMMQGGRNIAVFEVGFLFADLDGIKFRAQSFFDDMQSWGQIRMFGNPNLRSSIDAMLGKMIIALNGRIGQFEYFRKVDCPHCPHD